MPNLYSVSNLRTRLFPSETALVSEIARIAGKKTADVYDLRIVKRSVDARKKPKIFHVVQIEFRLKTPLDPVPKGVRAVERSALDIPVPSFTAGARYKPRPMDPVVVVGSGPAGLFAALSLGRAGVPTVLLERGKQVDERLKDIGRLRTRGDLDLESNICFGEGGAGTYTDGKLYTRIKHPYARWVLKSFCDFGASPNILIDSHPHLGTENLVAIVRRMRKELETLGVSVRFGTRMEGLILKGATVRGVRLSGGETLGASSVVLAVGHSARDTLESLLKDGVQMEAKAFAVGLRAEHPQELINAAQYGRSADARRLGAAAYQFTHQVKDAHLPERGIYSFCMCPGGFIVPSPTESGRMAINGMSNSNRSTPYANSGVVVEVTPEDLIRHGLRESALIGVAFQRELESSAYAATKNPFSAPAMRMTDFMKGRSRGTLAPTNFRPKAEACDITPLLPRWLIGPLREGLSAFDKKVKGYVCDEANLLAVESRTSSPVRITRNESGESVSTPGLYPAGEGAGYAGGIVSAAVDGLKAAQAVIARHGGGR